jgi:hypothetical protein
MFHEPTPTDFLDVLKSSLPNLKFLHFLKRMPFDMTKTIVMSREKGLYFKFDGENKWRYEEYFEGYN